jgi:uncharacterized membrane protein
MRAEAEAFLLAAAAAVTFDAGVLLLKARGDRLPPLGWPPKATVLRAYGADHLWLLGLLLQPAGYALYLWALALGQVALVQPVMSAGIVVFVGFAVLILGERLHRAEWLAVAAVAAGLFLLGSGRAPEGEAAAGPTGAAWAVGIYSAGVIGAAAGWAIWGRGRASGVVLGVWSGALLGLASLYAKGFSTTLARLGLGPWFWTVVADPYLYLTTLGNVAGFYVLLNALRQARAGVVFALSSTLSNVVPIVGAMVGMGERLPEDTLAAALRIAALLLTLGGAAALARFDPSGHRWAAPAIDTQPPV